jgi:diaminopimelate epimerase
MRLRFSKYEGLGNDFVIVEVVADEAGVGLEAAARICDRHLGVGADGVLLVRQGSSGVGMKVINADGSVPEMCGNGIRCVALHLVRTGRAASMRLTVDTDAGPHACRVLRGGVSGLVEVSMRAPSLLPSDVPVLGNAPLRDADFVVGAETLRITAVSMGNPHAVTFDDVGQSRTTLGPMLQQNPSFPQGVNVGFARLVAPQRIALAVLERGAGWTQACGTGACAAAVAAVETGRAERERPIDVDLPGGTLTIVVGKSGERLSMTGPARHVFDGVIDV